MNPLFSISHIASSRHSPATFKPIIVAQGCSSALPGDTYAYHRRPTVLLGTTGRHLRPLSLPNGTGLTYSLTSQIHPSLKSLDSSPPPFKPALSGRHLSPLSLPNGTPWHYRATLSPIIVAQGYWPDIFTHFTNSPLTQKPRLFSTSLQARTLRATLKPIIVAQRYSLALPGDTFAHYCRPTVLLGTPGRHLSPLSSSSGTDLI